MGRIALKDQSYKIIGYIDTDASGKQTALDASYKKVGYYDPRTDKTQDGSFRIIGSGNQLAALIR
jgi:hypothetical protein